MKLIFIALIVVLTAGCSSKNIYLAPAISGQLLDEKTNHPIVNKGNVFTMIKKDGSNIAKTNHSGNFYVEAIESNPLSESVYRSIPTIVTFNVEGYKIKKINYNLYELNPKSTSREVKKTLDMGKVYLESK